MLTSNPILKAQNNKRLSVLGFNSNSNPNLTHQDMRNHFAFTHYRTLGHEAEYRGAIMICLYHSLMVLCLMLFVTGCGVVMPLVRNENKLTTLSLGQDRQDVLRGLGNPDSVRGATILENGSKVQVDEYQLYSTSASAFNAVLGVFSLTISWWSPPPGQGHIYWVQYNDGKLNRWGRAGDWNVPTQDITVRQR